MQQAALVVGVVLVIAGLVWIGQGLGIVPGSFMSGDRFWAGAGAVTATLGAGVIAWARRRGRLGGGSGRP